MYKYFINETNRKRTSVWQSLGWDGQPSGSVSSWFSKDLNPVILSENCLRLHQEFKVLYKKLFWIFLQGSVWHTFPLQILKAVIKNQRNTG